MTKVYTIKLNKPKDKQIISEDAWNMLNKILLKDYNINIHDYEIIRNKYNKPYINPNMLYFNISHSFNMIVICISNNECGIDIEKIRNHEKHLALANKILCEEEYIEYEKCINKYDYLFKKWTMKESYFKCKGTGIIYSELNKSFDFSNTLTFKYIYDDKIQNEEYYISVTVDKESLTNECIQFEELEI